MVCPKGFEPWRLPSWSSEPCGLGNRRLLSVDCSECNACVNGKALHAPQYAPALVPDLARIVATWDRLPEPIRRAIRALVEAAEARHDEKT